MPYYGSHAAANIFRTEDATRLTRYPPQQLDSLFFVVLHNHISLKYVSLGMVKVYQVPGAGLTRVFTIYLILLDWTGLTRVFAFYLILLDWKPHTMVNIIMKPTNSPAQGQPNKRRKSFKVAVGSIFSHKYYFGCWD